MMNIIKEDYLMGTFTLIAAIIAAVASVWSTFTQRKIAKEQINAEVKSKARIEWIQKVRIEAANFITQCTLFEEYSPKIKVGDPIIKKVDPTEHGVTITAAQGPDTVVHSNYEDVISDKDLEEVRRNVIQSGNRLILYFGPDTSGDNDEVITYINNIMDIVKVRKDNWKIKDVQSNSKKLRELLRKYLKKEWNKAKLGK